jgi:hypothetical protein
MDEIRFYNRSLNSSEISDLYNLGSANASRVLAMDFNSNGLNYLNLNYSNRSLYEQGISIQDNSIYNYSGTSSGLTKQYWWNGNTAGTSVINGSLQFDGVNDYVNLGDINSFVSGTDNLPFSISAWIKMVGNSTAIVSRGNLASPNREYYFYVSSGNLTFRLKDMTVGGTPEAIVLGNQTLNADIWYNVIATYDGNDTSPSSGMNVYINGVNSSTARLTESGFIAMRNQASNIFRVGSLTWGTFVSPVSFYANGSIDDVIVFSRALNATEISTIYTEGLAGRTVGMDLSSNDSRTIPATNRVGVLIIMILEMQPIVGGEIMEVVLG